MLHPLFSTVLGHPELIADHVGNYVALIKEEASHTGRGLLSRFIAGALAAVSGVLALGLIGVAVMLGMLNGSFHWVLVIVPGIAVLIAAISAYVATRPSVLHGFAELQSQFDADLQALHRSGKRHER